MTTTQLFVKLGIPAAEIDGPPPVAPPDPPVVRQQVRDHFRNEFSGHIYGRAVRATIIDRDAAALTATYVFPATGHVGQRWGNEHFALFACDWVDAERHIMLDGDKSKPVGKLARVDFGGDTLKICVRFNSSETFQTLTADGAGCIEMRYRITKWNFATPTDITILTIDVAGVGLFSPGNKPKEAKKRQRELGRDPVARATPVRFPVTIDADKREIVVQCNDSKVFECGMAKPVRLAPSARFNRLIGRPIFPSVNGVTVPDALPVGRLLEITWKGDTIDDPESACQAEFVGRKLFDGQCFARIALDDTPPGRAELAAFLAQEKRAVVLTAKVHRHIPELRAKEYTDYATEWEPLALSIDGATVAAPADPPAIAPDAEAPRPGFLKRAWNAIADGRPA